MSDRDRRPLVLATARASPWLALAAGADPRPGLVARSLLLLLAAAAVARGVADELTSRPRQRRPGAGRRCSRSSAAGR